VECLKLHSLSSRTGFVLVRTLKTGEHFGELALINNEKRSLSIRVSSEKCKLLKLDRETFTRILGSIKEHLHKDYDKEFDLKMAKINLEKRTFSQTFTKDNFYQISCQD
jgi:CRP-like cAMP-binding protein